MSKDFVHIANEVADGIGLLRQAAPDSIKAFGALSVAATAAHAIDTKTKELMALAIGIAVHCDGCVAYHTKMAHQQGASKDEVAETVALAVPPRSTARMRCALTSNSAARRVSGRNRQYRLDDAQRRSGRHLAVHMNAVLASELLRHQDRQGRHVFARLARLFPEDNVKIFAEALARLINPC